MLQLLYVATLSSFDRTRTNVSGLPWLNHVFQSLRLSSVNLPHLFAAKALSALASNAYERGLSESNLKF